MATDGFWTTWPTSPASFYSGAIAEQMGPRGKVSSFANAQGLRLACYYWPAATEQPKAVVQLLHGSGAYVMEFLRSQARGITIPASSDAQDGRPLRLTYAAAVRSDFEHSRSSHCAQGAGKPQVYAGSWVERLNAAGISVAGDDMQVGQGASWMLGVLCRLCGKHMKGCFVGEVHEERSGMSSEVGAHLRRVPCTRPVLVLHCSLLHILHTIIQGCGFSEALRGLRGFFNSLDDVIADATQFRRCWHHLHIHSERHFSEDGMQS